MVFAGHHNFEKFADFLLTQKLADNITHVLLTGGSAGGFGTFTNVDYLQSRLPSAVVKGSPDEGYFMPGSPPWEKSASPDFVSDYPHYSAGIAGSFADTAMIAQTWDSYNLSAACVEDRGDEYWHCQTAHVALNFIQAPMFWAQNQFDSQQITQEDMCPNDGSDASNAYISYFGNATVESMKAGLPTKDGAFVPSCYAHGVSATIGDVEYLKAMSDWFWDRATTVLFDDCTSKDGMPCNSGC